MKIINQHLIALALIIFNEAHGQSTFVRNIQAGTYSRGSICRLADHDVAILYNSFQSSQHWEGVFKLDSANVLFQHEQLNTSNSHLNMRIFPTADSGYFTIGSYIEKIDKSGSSEFQQHITGPFIGPQLLFLIDGIQTHDGGYLLTSMYTDSLDRCVIIKLNSAGGVSWAKSTIAVSSGGNAHGIILSSNDDSTVTVFTWTYPDNSLITKFDLNGNILFSKHIHIGGGPAMPGWKHSQLVDKAYIFSIAGTVLKTDSTVTPQWRKSYSCNGFSIYPMLVSDAMDGSGFFIGGYYTDGSFQKPVFFKTDLNGQPLWGQIFDNIETISGFCETGTTGNSIVLTGDSLPSQLFVCKLDSASSCCISASTSITSTALSLPYVSNSSLYTPIQMFSNPTLLSQSNITPSDIDYCQPFSVDQLKNEAAILFPNPFYQKINIRVSAFEKNLARIINSAGEVVFETENVKESDAIDLSLLPAGIYLLLLQTERELLTSKLVKLQ